MHNPRKIHNTSVRQVLLYLKGRLVFQSHGHTNVDYASSIVDKRSTSRYYLFLAENLITLHNKKQPVVSRSSMKSKLKAMAQDVCEILWIKGILEDLKIQYESPMKLFCDNKSSINIAHNLMHHDQTKHVEVDYHFIKKEIENETLSIQHVRSKEQCANIFTKKFYGPTIRRLLGKLGMVDIHSPT